MNRRIWLAGVLAGAAALAQAQQPASGAAGVFSPLGDTGQEVAATEAPTEARSRGPIDVRTADGAVSALPPAPGVETRVQRMDAMSGERLRSCDIEHAPAHAAQDRQAAPDPCSLMPMADKVSIVRRTVDEGMGRAMQEPLAQR